MLRSLFDRSLFRGAALFTLSNVLNSGVAFFLIPVLTRRLTPADYGVIAMFAASVALLSPFVGFLGHAALTNRYFERERRDLPRYVTSCLSLVAASSLVYLGLAQLFAPAIHEASSIPPEWQWAIVATAAAQVVVAIVLGFWQLEQRPLAYGSYQLAQTVMNVGFSLALVMSVGMDWRGRVLGQSLALGVSASVGLAVLWRKGYVKAAWAREDCADAVVFGGKLIPHVLGGTIGMMLGQVMVKHMVGIADSGLYAVGAQVGMLIGVLENSFNQAWVPWLYARLHENDEAVRRRIVKITYAYCVAITALAAALALVAPYLIGTLVGRAFQGSVQHVLWIALGFAFTGMYKMVANYIFFAERTELLGLLTPAMAVVSLVLTWALIRANGAVGAAQANALASCFMFLSTWALAQRAYPMPWRLR